MPKSYSQDLRRRVVAYVEIGHSRRGTAAHFAVSPSFVINLMKAWQQTGSLEPKPEGGWRYSKLDPHREFLIGRIGERADITMPELAAELALLGTVVAPSTLSRWLRRKDFRYIKNSAGQRARSPRRPPGPPGVDRQTPAQDGARAASPGLHR